MISRRPNRRASSEKAPGPRRKIALAMVTTKTLASLAASKSGIGMGNHKRAIPTPTIPAMIAATGVTKPMRRAAPIASARMPDADLWNVGLSQSTKEAPA